MELELRPLPGVGVDVRGVSAAAVSALDPDSPSLHALADALEEHDLLWLHAKDAELLTPLQLRELYTKLHQLRFPQLACEPPSTPPPERRLDTQDTNLRGRCFPGFPETNVLGYAAEVLDWHGLTGRLEPTAWWEKQHGQFHHDGGFSARAPLPPALVSMHCHEAPANSGGGTTTPALQESAGGSGDDGGSKAASSAPPECPLGSTLFYSTRKALQLAPAALAARARRLRCVYTAGFGRVRVGEYPLMSNSMVTPTRPPPAAEGAAAGPAAQHRSITEFTPLESLAFGEGEGGEGGGGGGAAPQAFRHQLVQRDARGREYVVVHSVCLDYLEERADGSGCSAEDGDDPWTPLSWDASQAFLEAILAPAARPPHLQVISWRTGDVLLWDNLSTQHSVTPTDAYSFEGQRRLMTRTAMQPRGPMLA